MSMKKSIPMFPNLNDISPFDDIRMRILDRINVDYVKFHSGVGFIENFGINELRAGRLDPADVKENMLKKSLKEKFLDDSV